MWNDLSAAAMSWSLVALLEIMIVLNVLFLMDALPSNTLMMSALRGQGRETRQAKSRRGGGEGEGRG